MNADLHGFWEGNVYWVYVVRGVGNCNLMVEFQTKTLDEFERVKDKVSNEFSGLIADEKTVQLIEEHKCTYFPGSLG